MFVGPAVSQVGGDEIATSSIVYQGSSGYTMIAISKNSNAYKAHYSNGSLGDWSYQNSIFGVVSTNSNSSVGEVKQLFR